MNFRCIKCKKDKPESDYYYNGKYRRSKCKTCISVEGRKRRKRIPLVLVQDALKEIIYRTGSERKAAIELGISRAQLRTWIRKNKNSKNGKRAFAKNIEKGSVKLILATLHRLRKDNVIYDSVGKAGPKPKWYSVDARDAEYKRRRRASS